MVPACGVLDAAISLAARVRVGWIKYIAQFEQIERWTPLTSAIGKVLVKVCACGRDVECAQHHFCVSGIVEVRILHEIYPPAADHSTDRPPSSWFWEQVLLTHQILRCQG